MHSWRKIQNIRGTLGMMLILALLSSFALHAVQIPHTHVAVTHENGGHAHNEEKKSPGISMLEVAMHLSDKKLFLLTITSIILLAWFFSRKIHILCLLRYAQRYTKNTQEKYGDQFRVHDYFSLYFRKGIYHSKVY